LVEGFYQTQNKHSIVKHNKSKIKIKTITNTIQKSLISTIFFNDILWRKCGLRCETGDINRGKRQSRTNRIKFGPSEEGGGANVGLHVDEEEDGGGRQITYIRFLIQISVGES